MAATLDQALQCLLSEQPDKGNIAKQKKEARKAIIEHMKTNNTPCIEFASRFISLTTKLVKPTINAEFLAKAYQGFHATPQYAQVQAEGKAHLAYAEYVYALQKHLSVVEDDLKISKKKPMEALIMHDFKVTNS